MPVIGGDHIFEADGTFDGTVGGDVIVEAGATLRLSAAVGGDVVNKGGTVEMEGPDR